MPAEGTITLGQQKARVTASPTTLSGAPASIDGVLQGELLSGDALIEPGSGPLDLVIRQSSTTGAGDAVVRVFGDADLGAGVVTIEDVVTIHFVSELAANLGVGVTSEPL